MGTIWITISITISIWTIPTKTIKTITRASTRKATNTEAQRSDWTKAWSKLEVFKSTVTVTVIVVNHPAIQMTTTIIHLTNQSKSSSNISEWGLSFIYMAWLYVSFSFIDLSI